MAWLEPSQHTDESLWSPIAAFGSFALLIALGAGRLRTCWPGRGGWLMTTKQPTGLVSPEQLADTARRRDGQASGPSPGPPSALVSVGFTNDFSITYILEHSNRALPIACEFLSAAARAGELGLRVGIGSVAAYGFALRLTHKPT